MALTQLNTTITTLRDAAAKARANQTAMLGEIRSNQSLSSTGKSREIAKVYRTTRDTIRDLDRREQAALEKTRSDLERKIFGQYAKDPTSLIAYRDAQDRASRLGRDDKHHAEELLRSAHRSGDDVLAAAIVGRALTFGWEKLIEAHSDRHPTAGTDLKDLSDLVHFQSNVAEDMQRGLDYGENKPEELIRYTDQMIDDIADDTPSPAAALYSNA
ncbi:hypothetical protein [Microbacterium dauci]|uniref:DUF4142 domain-containing protein n=1 Tax=Microbacterium dauci TaxID=3048008 RepID=A0ABT6ZCB3_9MICO|nr:hypothetical protein [Microbacterium sp. LX3-4]MDJ1113794.1 hypothetical protein [Microbacterium sp. LX3-4]